MCICVGTCVWLQVLESMTRDVGALELGLQWLWTTQHRYRNWTRVLFKNRKCSSLLSHFSSPPHTHPLHCYYSKWSSKPVSYVCKLKFLEKRKAILGFVVCLSVCLFVSNSVRPNDWLELRGYTKLECCRPEQNISDYPLKSHPLPTPCLT